MYCTSKVANLKNKLLITALLALCPSFAMAEPIEGYLSHFSALPSETIKLYTSTESASFDVKIYRLGVPNQLIASYDNIVGKHYPQPANAWRDGAQWQDPLSITIPNDWKSDIYEVEISTQDTTQTLNFIVKASEPGASSGILMLDNATTKMAYNNWGGKSLYSFNSQDHKQAVSVSRLRPGQSGSAAKEKRFARWADAMNITIEHASSFDLHEQPTLLQNYQALVLVGHSEYWTKQMRNHYDNFVASGGNVVILSGNTMWWQIRLEENNMVCYKSGINDPMVGIDDSVVTTNFHESPLNWPENSSIGLSFRHGGYVNFEGNLPASEGYGGYTITQGDHPVLSGSELLDGDMLGQEQTIVGYEADGALIDWVDGKPVVTGADQTPIDFKILGLSEATQGHAIMGIFGEGGTGGMVFNAATVDWADGLWWPAQNEIPNPQVSKITANVLALFAPQSAASCLNSSSTVDTDGDTITDVCDSCVLQSNPAQLDFDGDKNGDVCDVDDDNDGILDINDTYPFDATNTPPAVDIPDVTPPATSSGGGSLGYFWLLLLTVLAKYRRTLS